MTNWSELILEYKKSEISISKFCELHSLNANTFKYILQKHRKKTDSFISVKPAAIHPPLEIVYPNGVRILVNQNLSSEQLKALIYV